MEGELEVENIQANPKMAGNPHDLIGIKGIIEAQNTEIKMKIVYIYIYMYIYIYISLASNENRE